MTSVSQVVGAAVRGFNLWRTILVASFVVGYSHATSVDSSDELTMRILPGVVLPLASDLPTPTHRQSSSTKVYATTGWLWISRKSLILA